MSEHRERIAEERAERRKSKEPITTSHVCHVGYLDRDAVANVFSGSREGRLRNIKVYVGGYGSETLEGTVHLYVYEDLNSSPKVFSKPVKDYLYFKPIKVEGKPTIIKVGVSLTENVQLAFEATYDFK
jgi:hypothetical protein